MPGDIRDLDQVRAALHGASHEAGAEAVPTKCRRIEAELKRAGLCSSAAAAAGSVQFVLGSMGRV